MSPNLDLADTVARALDGPAGAAIRATVLAELVEAGLEPGDPANTLAELIDLLDLGAMSGHPPEEVAHDLLAVRAERHVLEVESLPESERLRRLYAAEAELGRLLGALEHVR